MKRTVFVVVLSALLLATLACGTTDGGGGAQVTLVNNSGSTVCYAYISPNTESTWGDDLLGVNTVSSGSSYVFDVAPGVYDLRADDCDNNVLYEEYGVNISGSYTWSIP